VEDSQPELARLSIDEKYNPRLRIANSAELFARWKTGAEAARAQQRFAPDLRYGAAPAETLDFFPARRPGSPLLVFVHGGYWRAFEECARRRLQTAWGTATIRSTFEVPDADHFTVCDAFSTRGSALFDATCALLRGES
jgi:hypothetical protein